MIAIWICNKKTPTAYVIAEVESRDPYRFFAKVFLTTVLGFFMRKGVLTYVSLLKFPRKCQFMPKFWKLFFLDNVNSELLFGSGPNLTRLCLTTRENVSVHKKSKRLWRHSMTSEKHFFFIKPQKGTLDSAWLHVNIHTHPLLRKLPND